MSRLIRVAAAIALMLLALASQRLAFPAGAFACSCAAPDPAAPAFTGEEQAVFIGTAGRPLENGAHEFAVERWYVGGDAPQVQVASEREPMPGGGMAVNTCGLHFEVGDRLIMAAGFAQGIYTPGLCSPHAVAASDEGARLIAAAEATFGGGFVPNGEPWPSVGDAAFAMDVSVIALGAVGLIVVLTLLVTVYAVSRRGSKEGET